MSPATSTEHTKSERCGMHDCVLGSFFCDGKHCHLFVMQSAASGC